MIEIRNPASGCVRKVSANTSDMVRFYLAASPVRKSSLGLLYLRNGHRGSSLTRCTFFRMFVLNVTIHGSKPFIRKNVYVRVGRYRK
jgi:hypothetical protein